MRIDELEAYVASVAAMIGLPISELHRVSVEQDFSRIAAVAATLMEFPLDQSIQAAPVFQP